MTAQPIAVKVTRHKCPFCPRTAARPVRAREHMARCWFNPEARGCKTCKHFAEAESGDFEVGYGGADEGCDAGVDLSGRPECDICINGRVHDDFEFTSHPCSSCGGNYAEIKPGPIVHCERWEAA